MCAGSVLREICSEEQLVLVYRVSFELRKAKEEDDELMNNHGGFGREVRHRVTPVPQTGDEIYK